MTFSNFPRDVDVALHCSVHRSSEHLVWNSEIYLFTLWHIKFGGNPQKYTFCPSDKEKSQTFDSMTPEGYCVRCCHFFNLTN